MSNTINRAPEVATQNMQKAENDNTPKNDAQIIIVMPAGENTQKAPTTNENKAPALNFEGFQKKERAAANELATRSLNEVKDLTRDFNHDFPATAYSPDYTSFPKPDDFSAKNFGGKEKAFVAWKDAVKEWVEDCKQDIQTLKATGIEDLKRQINENFIRSWEIQGLTRDVIMQTLQKVDYDIQAASRELKHTVQNEAAKIKSTVRSESARTRETVREEAGYIHQHIGDAEAALHDHIENAKDDIKSNDNGNTLFVANKIQVDGDKTRTQIDMNKQEEKEKNELKEKINLALRNEPNKTKKAIEKVLEAEGKRFDYNRFTDNLDKLGSISHNSTLPDLIDTLDKTTLQMIVNRLDFRGNPWTN